MFLFNLSIVGDWGRTIPPLLRKDGAPGRPRSIAPSLIPLFNQSAAETDERSMILAPREHKSIEFFPIQDSLVILLIAAFHPPYGRFPNMQSANPGLPLLVLLFLVLTIIAIVGAKRRWRTVLIIGAWMLAGFAIGAGTGFILGSLGGGNRGGAAGTLAGSVMWLGGLMGALRCIMNNRRTRSGSTAGSA